jgi:hypothetical protein
MSAILDKYLNDNKKKKPTLEQYSQPTLNLSNNYYSNQMTSLEQLYGKQKQDLTAQYQNQLQQAAIAQRMREKYLGNQLSAYGIKDTGLAQSSLVNLQNAYGTQRGNIGQAYQTGLSSLESNYLTNRSNLEQSQYEMNLGQQQNLYNDLAGYISQTETKEQAQSLLDRYKGGISDTQYKLLQDQIGLQNYEEDETAKIEAKLISGDMLKYDNKSTGIQYRDGGRGGNVRNVYGDNIELIVNGKSLRVETGDLASEEVLKAIGNKLKNKGEVAIYNGTLYIVTDTGAIRAVKARKSSYKEDYGKLVAYIRQLEEKHRG